MHHYRRAGLCREIGEESGVHHEDHVGIGSVYRLGDQLPRGLADEPQQPR